MEAATSFTPERTQQQSYRIQEFLDEVRDNEFANVPGKDPRIASFSSAVLLEYKGNPDFNCLIDEWLLARDDIEQPSLAANILLRVFQKQLLRKDNEDGRKYPYPEPYDSVL